MLAARQREPVVIIVNPSLKLILIRSRGGTIFRQRFVGPSTEYGLETLTASPTATVEVFPNGVATSNMTVRAATAVQPRGAAQPRGTDPCRQPLTAGPSAESRWSR